MPSVPAFCDTCGTVFNSGIFVENSTNISFAGNLDEPHTAAQVMPIVEGGTDE